MLYLSNLVWCVIWILTFEVTFLCVDICMYFSIYFEFIFECISQIISNNTNGYLCYNEIYFIINTQCSISILTIYCFSVYCDCTESIYLDWKLIIFMLSVIHLILVDTLCCMLITYELIGIISFRLIGHYLLRNSALRGGTISLLYNSLGDLLLLAISGVTICWNNYLFINYEYLMVALCLFQINSIGIFSYLWLPDAMEGPTPVSALLHSATLVISGIIIFNNLFVLNYISILAIILGISILIVVSSVTIDADINNQAAISTCSVLNIIWIDVLITGNNAWLLAVCHAGYNSVMFVLLANLLLHHQTQDIRSILLLVCLNMLNINIVMILFCIGGMHYVYGTCNVGLNLVICNFNLNALILCTTMIIFVMSTLNLFWILFILDAFVNCNYPNCVRYYIQYALIWCLFSMFILWIGIIRVYHNTQFVYFYLQCLCIGSAYIILILNSLNTMQLNICAVYFNSITHYVHAVCIIFMLLSNYNSSISTLNGQLLFICVLCLI